MINVAGVLDANRKLTGKNCLCGEHQCAFNVIGGSYCELISGVHMIVMVLPELLKKRRDGRACGCLPACRTIKPFIHSSILLSIDLYIYTSTYILPNIGIFLYFAIYLSCNLYV